jgi:hypothetical protein
LLLTLGFFLATIGIAAMAGFAPALVNYTYAITWWGLLTVIDEWNWRRRRLSIWRECPLRFFLVTAPFSVAFWLIFELLNLASPQWRYRGDLTSIGEEAIFGFVSFATVTPIIVEFHWLTAGSFHLPSDVLRFIRRNERLLIAGGILLLLLPLFHHTFWLNQGMWIAPAFLVIPLVALSAGPTTVGRTAREIAVTGILSGIAWELLNWFSRSHWEYLILPTTPHLFQMPVIGYLGFIPFAFAALICYEAGRQMPMRPAILVCLWATTLSVLYALTVIYNQRGLWISLRMP